MRLNKLGERKIIEKIAAMFRGQKNGVVTSIGDDAAVTLVSPGKCLISTVDTLTEGVHFLRTLSTPRLLGEKLINISVSDIAAMGGVPRYCLISIAIPQETEDSYLSEIYKGIKKACQAHKVALVGGNTSASRFGITLNSIVLGEAAKEQTVLRSRARPGDAIIVTGTLGDSALGLNYLKKQGLIALRAKETSYAVKKHLSPTARSKEGAAIGKESLASSMTDISDGLITDIGNIAKAACVGAEIRINDIPLSPAFKRHLKTHPSDISLALSGGEDYELLFTIRKRDIGKLRKLAARLSVPLTEIGRITKGHGIKIIDADGRRIKTKKTGYEHFGL